MPCNLQVARDRAADQNAAVEGAVLIAQQEAAEWQEGMAIHASAIAAITAVATAASAREAAAARERRVPCPCLLVVQAWLTGLARGLCRLACRHGVLGER